MKRFSMAMTWLAVAGLMTMVSCRKPVMGFTNGEARTVTVSAVTENGGGSKTAIEGLNVKWSVGDKIKMNGCVLELTDGAGGTMGRFAGEVTGGDPYYIGYPADATTCDGTTLKLNIQAEWTYDVEKQEVPMVAYVANVDDDVYFRNAVNMLKLQLKGDGTDASKLKSIELTSTTSNLSGDIEVTFDGATPTFNAIADGTKTMTVSFGDGLQLGNTVKCVYIPLARISGGDLTVRFVCANGIYVEKKLTATSSFDAVNNMLDCGEVTVNAAPVFSVGENTTVEFAPGNLYWDGNAFRFEENQWSTTPTSDGTWDESHLSHFKWSDAATTVTGDYDNYSGDLFCASNFTVAGDSHIWRTLTVDEWNYLLGYDPELDEQTDKYGRPGARNLCAWMELDGGTHKGLVILPDGTENPSGVLGNITLTSDLATYGAVFLPAAGNRNGTYVDCVGAAVGFYWSSIPYDEVNAYYMSFYSGGVNMSANLRDFGYSVRLVR